MLPLVQFLHALFLDDIGKMIVTPVPLLDLENLIHQIPGHLAKKLPEEIRSAFRARDVSRVSSPSCTGDPCLERDI